MKKYIVFLAVIMSIMLILSSCGQVNKGELESTGPDKSSAMETQLSEETSYGQVNEGELESTGSDESETTEIQLPEETSGVQSGIKFPYELEDGKLTVNSLFQSSIDNPDCNNEYADDIATLEVKNTSDEFLKEAKITVMLNDKTKIPIVITNLPAGKSVWAFATDNTAVELNPVCVEIACDAAFEKEMPILDGTVSYEVNETKVTLHNLSSDNLTGLSVGCHCLFDNIYYGGLTYSYDVDKLSASDSTTLDADDCYLGSAEVVCITSK